MPGLVLIPAESGESFSPDSPLVADVLPSPNHGERRNFLRADSIILHYTGMASAEAAIALLRAPAAEVSSHYVVEESGRIVQLVPEARRAWHAGLSCWRGERDMNSASIGVEICNPGHDGGSPPFPDRQIEAVIALCRDITERCAVRPERVLAHSDIAPARKRDPGEAFPWAALGRAGVGHWVEADPAGRDGAYLARSGGTAGAGAANPARALWLRSSSRAASMTLGRRTVVAAFQRHFRPAQVDGVADRSTVETLRRLLAALSRPANC